MKPDINKLLVENSKLRRNIFLEQNKGRRNRETILDLRKQLYNFKRRITRKQLVIRDRSVGESGLDVR